MKKIVAGCKEVSVEEIDDFNCHDIYMAKSHHGTFGVAIMVSRFISENKQEFCWLYLEDPTLPIERLSKKEWFKSRKEAVLAMLVYGYHTYSFNPMIPDLFKNEVVEFINKPR